MGSDGDSDWPQVHHSQDPVLAGLANRPKSEEDLAREAALQQQRAEERARAWKRRYWIRAALVVGGYGLAVLGLATFHPAGWRDAVVLPMVAAGIAAAAVWIGWHWLLAGVLLALVPPIAVLLLGGEVAYWFVKVPILAGLALIAGYATTWPSADD